MKIERAIAESRLRVAADLATHGDIDPSWKVRIEEFSVLCADGVAKTHIAFLATSILAKAVDKDVDLFAIKPTHDRKNARAYSARTLCHGVIVPLAAELGFSIGVTGREPLNNQPYFRMTRLDDGTPVHSGAKVAFDFMLGLVRDLANVNSEIDATRIMASFIDVRRRYQPEYGSHLHSGEIRPDRLLKAIRAFVSENSEGGRRAQGVVAGLLDACFGSDRIASGRINDPSRHYPGDVCVRDGTEPDIWEKAFEVRDKPVSESDVYIFASGCLSKGVREAAVVMTAEAQAPLDNVVLAKWAGEHGIDLTIFHGWDAFVDQVLFWSPAAKSVAAGEAAALVHQRLIDVEATPEAVARWGQLIEELPD